MQPYQLLTYHPHCATLLGRMRMPCIEVLTAPRPCHNIVQVTDTAMLVCVAGAGWACMQARGTILLQGTPALTTTEILSLPKHASNGCPTPALHVLVVPTTTCIHTTCIHTAALTGSLVLCTSDAPIRRTQYGTQKMKPEGAGEYGSHGKQNTRRSKVPSQCHPESLQWT